MFVKQSQLAVITFHKAARFFCYANEEFLPQRRKISHLYMCPVAPQAHNLPDLSLFSLGNIAPKLFIVC